TDDKRQQHATLHLCRGVGLVQQGGAVAGHIREAKTRDERQVALLAAGARDAGDVSAKRQVKRCRIVFGEGLRWNYRVDRWWQRWQQKDLADIAGGAGTRQH